MRLIRRAATSAIPDGFFRPVRTLTGVPLFDNAADPPEYMDPVDQICSLLGVHSDAVSSIHITPDEITVSGLARSTAHELVEVTYTYNRYWE